MELFNGHVDVIPDVCQINIIKKEEELPQAVRLSDRIWAIAFNKDIELGGGEAQELRLPLTVIRFAKGCGIFGAILFCFSIKQVWN